jgi:gamma-glutamyltranspeptidase/glutathione hydrolase
MPGRRARSFALGAASILLLGFGLAAQDATRGGVQDPAWSPDGRRLATSFFERIWISGADGRGGRPLRPSGTAVERDPAWSPDGRTLVFAANAGAGYDLFLSPAVGGPETRLTEAPGDERWPSYTRDGRIIFSRRTHAFEPWRLHVVSDQGGEITPLFPDGGGDIEREARVSPDGKRVAYISDRESADGDVDLWVADLAPARGRVSRTRITRVRGREGFPSWAPDGARLAYFAQREGSGSVWVASFDAPPPPDAPRQRPAAQPALVSRRGGMPAWSPDGRRIAIAEMPQAEPTYNGNPLRDEDDGPPAFATGGFALWTVEAPLPIDAGARQIAVPAPAPQQLTGLFDRTWESLRRLYYSSGPSAAQWTSLRDKYRPRAAAARDEAAVEAVIDALVAEQPAIKPPVSSKRAVVVSGHPLASQAGLLALEKGGNVVDAAIAVSFALGVVEPDASGIGGDGMALVFLTGMKEPVAIDYKDQVPIHATSTNPILRNGTGDGPSAANIPGVVAGLDHLYRTYGSKTVSWADLIAPAIEHAEQGYILDEALPTSIAEGRRYFEKYPESKRIFLPEGRVPKPGDRFVNRDYGSTLRAIAKDPQTFYRGEIARRIAADMARHGGLITLDDLAQYRAIERRPLAGQFRGHTVFSSPPPVSTGLQLIETLQILDNYRPTPGATYATDADYFHHAIESWKVRDQSGRIADPALWNVDLGPHLDRAHAAALFKRIDPRKASRMGGAPPAESTTPPERIGRGTTAFAVADADGNMIAVTQTLSTWGGTFHVSEGLGFLYNNHLRFGGGGAPGRFLPLARSSTTSVPTLIFKDAASVLAVAAAGNAWIPASVYDIILNVIDGGLPAQRAIEAPRFLIGRDPAENAVGRMQIEDRFPGALLRELESRGHRFTKIGRKGEVRYGYAAAVVIDGKTGEVQGGAEPRRSHAALAPLAR